jgi:DNA invertase Pin-like site-specific DNA recombinase
MQDGKSKLLEAVRRVRDEIYNAVKAELLEDGGANPRTYREVANANCISVATVQRIAGSLGISRQVGPRPKSATSEVSNGNE